MPIFPRIIQFVFADIAREHNAQVMVPYDFYFDAKNQLTSLNQRLSTLDRTIETLKIVKERQDREIEHRKKYNTELHSEKTIKQSQQIKTLNQRIAVLVEAEDHRKMEIEILKQQILEKEKELEFSSSKDMKSVESKNEIQEHGHGHENIQLCNQETPENEPKVFENQVSSVPPAEKLANANDEEEEEERKALEEAIEVLSSTKKATSELIARNLALEKEKEVLEVNLKKTHEMKRKLEENAKGFEVEKERIEALRKEKDDLKVKVGETNERKRKLEEDVKHFEEEKKRIKLQLEEANDANLQKIKEDHHELLSKREEQIKQKDKVIARQKFNLKILLDNVNKLKVKTQTDTSLFITQ